MFEQQEERIRELVKKANAPVLGLLGGSSPPFRNGSNDDRPALMERMFRRQAEESRTIRTELLAKEA